MSRFVINDEKYRAYAYKICQCNDLKNDLVQEMYLKLYKILRENPEKEISERYVYLMIYSSFVDYTRKLRPYYIEERILKEEPADDELSERVKISDALGEMEFFDREVLLRTQEQSLRKVGQLMMVSKDTVAKYRDTAIIKLKKICL